MMNPKFRNRIGKTCALVAATLILPVLAYAQQQGGNGGNQGGNQGGNGGNPVVPETNTAWVLIPLFGGVLLFSARRLFRAKA